MRTIAASLLIAAGILALGAGLTIYAGVYDVAATTPHWPATGWILETARIRSIKAYATGIAVPPGFNDPARIAIGVGHFAAHCAVCHGAPGVPRGDIARGLSPPPSDLAVAAQSYSAGELFWILKHGIKMTGMPAWSDHSDEQLWATVAFVQKLPGLTQDEYARMIVAGMTRGNHHHHEGDAEQPQGQNAQRH
jgi:mono/diheme cytochrome c family protein